MKYLVLLLISSTCIAAANDIGSCKEHIVLDNKKVIDNYYPQIDRVDCFGFNFSDYNKTNIDSVQIVFKKNKTLEK